MNQSSPAGIPAPQVMQHRAAAQAVRSLEFIDINPAWVAYRLSHHLELSPQDADRLGQHYPSSCVEGLAPTEAFADMLAGAAPWRPEASAPWPVLMPAELREQIGVKFFHEVVEVWDEHPSSNQPFTALIAGQVTCDDLVQMRHYSHTFHAMDGTALAQPLHFDYMSGRFSDGVYDLEKALEVLRQHPRVRPAQAERRSMPNPTELSILHVPYYNRSPGQSRHVSFVFMPTQAELDQMVAHRKEAWDSKDARFEAIFELDLLGLRKSGAAHCANYYESKDFEPQAEEDDEPF